jgi:flagellar biogenesis protein FliO
MKLKRMELARMQIDSAQIYSAQPEIAQTVIPTLTIPTPTFPRSSHFLALATSHLKVVCFAVWRWLVRARSRRKTLSVRETTALGDRRFVSVVQFERQRFLIGSSPSSVSLLSHLPDEPSSHEEPGEERNGEEHNGEKQNKESAERL